MKLKQLLIPPGVVFLCLLSWLFPPIRHYWNLLDNHAFYALSSWVRERAFWQNVWAFMGTRTMDGIHDSLMLLFLIYYVKKGAQTVRKQRVAELIFTAFLIFLTLYAINQMLCSKCLQLRRDSPTLACEYAFRLSHVIKWTVVKDQSRTSFPGDHATTTFLFASIVYHLMGWRAGILTTFYAIIASLPRLVAGAHWLTDVLLGSSMIALSISSLAFATPIAHYCTNGIQRGIFWTGRKREKMPSKNGGEQS